MRFLKQLLSVRGLPQILLGAFAFSNLMIGLFPDLGLNLLAEVIGVAFTVFVIDALLRKRDRVQLKPLLLSAAKRYRAAARDALNLASAALESSVGPRDAALFEEIALLSDARLRPIYRRLMLALPMNRVTAVVPNIQWVIWGVGLQAELGSIRAHLHSFAERFAGVIDPEVVEAAQALEEALLFNLSPHLATTGLLPDTAFTDLSARAERLAQTCDALDGGSEFPKFNAERLLQILAASPNRSADSPWRHVELDGRPTYDLAIEARDAANRQSEAQ